MSRRTVFQSLESRENNYAHLESELATTTSEKYQLVDVDVARQASPSDTVLNRTGTFGSGDYVRTPAVRKQQDRLLDDTLKDVPEGPTLAVIIPCRGQTHFLLECLDALSRQSIFHHTRRRQIPVEILVVQDGEGPERVDDLLHSKEELDRRTYNEVRKFPKSVRFSFVRLSKNYGRCTPRNLGLHLSQNQVSVFIDSRVLLDECALGEVWIRFAKLPNSSFALLGFKENLTPQSHGELRHLIRMGIRRPNMLAGPASDWKVRRLARKDMTEEQIKSGAIQWRNHVFAADDVLDYMALTDWLRALRSDEAINNRYPGYFLSTAMVAVRRDRALAVNGFHADLENSWGFEDSLFGTLLTAQGVQIIPCPTFSAFLIDKSAIGSDSEREQDKKLNRQTVIDRLHDPLSDHETISEFQRRLPKKGADFVILKPDPAQRKIETFAALPIEQRSFTHARKDTAPYEDTFLGLMQACLEQDDRQFKTLSNMPPFFFRTLWEQHERQRHQKRLDTEYVDMFYYLRERYDLWQKLLEKGKIQVLLDQQRMEEAMLEAPIRAATSDAYFSLESSAAQLTNCLRMMDEFPRLDIRLTLDNTGQTYFIGDDAVLTYHNRVPKMNAVDKSTRSKGDFFPAGNVAATTRVQQFDSYWAETADVPTRNRAGTYQYFKELLDKVSSKILEMRSGAR